MIGIRRIYGLASLVSLILGMGIYLFFRNTNMLLIFEWLPQLRVFKGEYFTIERSIFGSFFLFNLPDALWFLSGIFFLRFIWFHNFKEQNVYLLCFYLLGAVFEISQLSDNIPGTFDFLDLFFLVFCAIIEGLINYFFIKRRSR